jgi:ABC-2 type transport system permease protein
VHSDRASPTANSTPIYSSPAPSNPAILAFNFPPEALDTIGGQIAFQIGAPGLVIVGLMALLTVVRLTRGEEEPGRLELIRALPVGRNAPIVAAAAIGLGMSLFVGGASAVALVATGQAASGSILYGLQLASVAAVFVGVSLVTAQITENARLAGGLAGVVLAAAFVVRAIGDMRSLWLSWLSPIGWAQQTRAFGDQRWWPLVLSLALLTGLVALAVALQSRRDLGEDVARQQHGAAFALDLMDALFEDLFHQWIETGRGFVEDQQLGIRGERGDQADLLAVALGVRPRLLRGVQFESVDQFVAFAVVRRATQPGEQVDDLAA